MSRTAPPARRRPPRTLIPRPREFLQKKLWTRAPDTDQAASPGSRLASAFRIVNAHSAQNLEIPSERTARVPQPRKQRSTMGTISRSSSLCSAVILSSPKRFSGFQRCRFRRPALIFPCGLCCNPAGHFRARWQKTCSTTRVRVVSGTVAPVYERPGYRTLLGRIRENVRTYIRKQLELPRQEIAEILAANKRAAIWLGVAAGLGFMTLITLVFLIVALVALIPREWLGVLVLALAVGTAFALFVLGVRAKAIVPAFIGNGLASRVKSFRRSRTEKELDQIVARLGGRLDRLKGRARKRFRETLKKEIGEVETGPRAKQMAWESATAALTAAATLFARRFISRLTGDEELPDSEA